MADVLVVDDVKAVRDAVRLTLSTKNHTVTEAENGELAIKLLEKKAYDIVITDIIMPDIDGTELIVFLNEMPKRPKIIAMSGGGAHVPPNFALGLAKTRADKTLTKPFHKNDLLSMVEQLLS